MIAANIGIFLIDRVMQQEVDKRQQQINNGAQINRVDQLLVRALATQAASTHDDALRDLLNHNGVTHQLTPPVSNDAPAASGALATPAAPASAPATGRPPAAKD
jgi:hypothetical protein